MLQRDYFKRLIEEFADALARFLEKPEGTAARQTALDDLYRQYVAPREQIAGLTTDELLRFAADQWSDEERLERLDMLSQLLFQEAAHATLPLHNDLMEKAYGVLSHVEQASKDFSISRRQRLSEMAKALRG